MSLETPECEAHGGSSHARGKRPPAVEINSFSSYPKNTDLRTNIYFAPERLLGYSTDTSWTSRAQEHTYFQSGVVRRSLHQLRTLKQQLFSMAQVSVVAPVPKLMKRAFINSIAERKGMHYDLL